MSENIDVLLKYYIKTTYAGRKNGYVAKVTGTLTDQYNLLEWDVGNPDPKPTILQLSTISTTANLQEKRRIKIIEMEMYADDMKQQQKLSYSGDIYSICSKNQNQISARASDGDKTRKFKAIDGSLKDLTKADMLSIIGLCEDVNELYDIKIYDYKNQINLSSDPESIDFKTGWPANPFTGA